MSTCPKSSLICCAQFPASRFSIRAVSAISSRPRQPMPPVAQTQTLASPAFHRRHARPLCSGHAGHLPQRRINSGRTCRRRQASSAGSFCRRRRRPSAAQRRGDGQGRSRCPARRIGDRRSPASCSPLSTNLLTNPERLASMAAAARTQTRPAAAERIASRLATLAHPTA